MGLFVVVMYFGYCTVVVGWLAVTVLVYLRMWFGLLVGVVFFVSFEFAFGVWLFIAVLVTAGGGGLCVDGVGWWAFFGLVWLIGGWFGEFGFGGDLLCCCGLVWFALFTLLIVFGLGVIAAFGFVVIDALYYVYCVIVW